MPLIAFRAGERLESWSMTAEAWLDLKRSYRNAGLTMSCGEEAVPKTSTIGTRFFAHKSGTDCWRHEGGPESREHIATKIAVAEAARSIGWDAVIEASAPDRSWIADVLLTKGTRTLAIEAQWAPQSLADFERRHNRYTAAGIECLWLTTAANARESALTVPHLIFGDDRLNLGLWAPGVIASELQDLGTCVQAFLREDILPIAEFIATHIIVATQMTRCWSCTKWMTLWQVPQLIVESRCGAVAAITWPNGWARWARDRHERALEIYVSGAMTSADLPRPAYLDTKFSKAEGVSYLALNCPSCRVVQGDGLIQWRFDPAEYLIPLGGGIRMSFSDAIIRRLHVCRDAGRGKCRQDAPGDTSPSLRKFPPEEECYVLDHSVPGIRLLPRRR